MTESHDIKLLREGDEGTLCGGNVVVTFNVYTQSISFKSYRVLVHNVTVQEAIDRATTLAQGIAMASDEIMGGGAIVITGAANSSGLRALAEVSIEGTSGEYKVFSGR